MTEQQLLLEETVDNVFKEMAANDQCLQTSCDFQSQWLKLQNLGIEDLFIPEEQGGFSGSWEDARIIFYLAGRHGIALPICETIVAKKLLLENNISIPEGPITIGINNSTTLILTDHKTTESVFSGCLKSVPWGNQSKTVVTSCENQAGNKLVLLQCQDGKCTDDRPNEAGEPRANIKFDKISVLGIAESQQPSQHLLGIGALMRASQISGALDAALQLSIMHAKNRQQFGRPLAKFQAIQQQLALFAEECAAVNCATLAAARATELGDSSFEIAAAKLRANRSIGLATSIAHQVHGAIGCTKEYDLHRFTQRLWSWRAEYGNDRFWARHLGQQVLAAKEKGFWKFITARSDCAAAKSIL